MGSVVKSVGGMLGIGGSVGKSNDSGLTQSNFDISKEAKKYEDIYTQQRQDAEARQNAANAPGVIGQLSQQAMGQGPSIAEAQLKSATNRNLAQQLAAAASMRGRNPAAAQRQILTAQGDAGRQLAEQSATARLQEQQQAQGQLAQQQQMADNLQQNSTSQGFQAAIAPKTADQEYDLARAGIRQQNNATDKGVVNNLLGSVVGSGATALMASDKNNKKDIKSGSADVSKFLDSLDAKHYEYKDTSEPGTAKGPRVGVLAQDVEKSDMGKTMVKDTPNGKMIDTVQGFGAVLAAQAEMNKRLKALEGKKSAKMADGGVVQSTVDNVHNFLNTLASNKPKEANPISIKQPGAKAPGDDSSSEVHTGTAVGNMPHTSNVGFSGGGKVPGQAKVSGDSQQNDVVDVKLSPGEIVIPRSHADNPDKAKEFVHALFEREMAYGGRVPAKKGKY